MTGVLLHCTNCQATAHTTPGTSQCRICGRYGYLRYPDPGQTRTHDVFGRRLYRAVGSNDLAGAAVAASMPASLNVR